MVNIAENSGTTSKPRHQHQAMVPYLTATYGISRMCGFYGCISFRSKTSLIFPTFCCCTSRMCRAATTSRKQPYQPYQPYTIPSNTSKVPYLATINITNIHTIPGKPMKPASQPNPPSHAPDASQTFACRIPSLDWRRSVNNVT